MEKKETRPGRVIVEVPVDGVAREFTYMARQPVYLGQRVTVPMREQSREGYVKSFDWVYSGPVHDIEAYHDCIDPTPAQEMTDIRKHVRWLRESAHEMMIRGLERADIADALEGKIA
jgi:primosomal protein N'